MKVAVITNNSSGVKFCSFLKELGSDVILFCSDESLVKGHESNFQRVLFQYPKWLQKKSIPLDGQCVGKERMKDLFRVVYEVRGDSGNVFSQEMNDSLESCLDVYVEVDGVVTIMDKTLTPNFSHPSGSPALGEIHYAHTPTLFSMPLAKDMMLPEDGDIALLGHHHLGRDVMVKLFDWLLEKSALKQSRRLFWISHKANPWDEIPLHVQHYQLKFKNRFEEKVQDFLDKKKAWEQLDDFIKVKYPKPEEPLNDVIIFAGHTLSSMDVLINSKNLYLTIDYSDLVKPLIQRENCLTQLKTISAAQLYIINGFVHEYPWRHFLTFDEPGFYFYPSQYYTVEQMVEHFKENFLIYFKHSEVL
jgi:hypothetical protein